MRVAVGPEHEDSWTSGQTMMDEMPGRPSMGRGYVMEGNAGKSLFEPSKHAMHDDAAQKTLVDEVDAVRKRLRESDGWIIDPHSRFIQRWDGVTFAALLFTAVVTPVEVAFSGSVSLKNTHEIPLFALNRIVDSVFITDFVLQFFMGFEDMHGLVVKSHRRIAVRYLTGWAIIDFVSSLPLETIMLVIAAAKGGGPSGGGSGGQFAAAVFAFTYTEISMYKFFFTLVLYAHWNACIWGMVAPDIAGFGSGYTWMDKLSETQSRVVGHRCSYDAEGYYGEAVGARGDASACEAIYDYYFDKTIVRHKYCASLYFAVYTMTGIGFGDISATGHIEVIVATAIMLCGAVFWAYMIGQFVTLVWYLREVTPPFVVDLSQAIQSLVYAPTEVIDLGLSLFIITNGIAARKGRIISKDGVWGEDFMLDNVDLIDMICTAALSYLEVICLSREKMIKILATPMHEAERKIIRMAVVFYTVKARFLQIGADAITKRLRAESKKNLGANTPSRRSSAWNGFLHRTERDVDGEETEAQRTMREAVAKRRRTLAATMTFVDDPNPKGRPGRRGSFHGAVQMARNGDRRPSRADMSGATPDRTSFGLEDGALPGSNVGSARPSLADPPGAPPGGDESDGDGLYGDGESPGLKRLTVQVTDLAGSLHSLARASRAEAKHRDKQQAKSDDALRDSRSLARCCAVPPRPRAISPGSPRTAQRRRARGRRRPQARPGAPSGRGPAG
ncbi:voltage-gated potassium channel [Aureococcus anophagefferens]|nr:voltage-gated potassium channel [Aureococcus anophagefferens]